MATLGDIRRTCLVGEIPVEVHVRQQDLLFNDLLENVPTVHLIGTTKQYEIQAIFFNPSTFFPDTAHKVMGLFIRKNLETGEEKEEICVQAERGSDYNTSIRRGNSLCFRTLGSLNGTASRTEYCFLTLRSPNHLLCSLELSAR